MFFDDNRKGNKEIILNRINLIEYNWLFCKECILSKIMGEMGEEYYSVIDVCFKSK